MKRRLRHFLNWPVLVAVAGALSYGWLFHVQQHQNAQGRQAHAALCVFKLDVRSRVASSARFIRDHPEGIPGIPVSAIRVSIANQQATLRSLGVLDCPKETP